MSGMLAVEVEDLCSLGLTVVKRHKSVSVPSWRQTRAPVSSRLQYRPGSSIVQAPVSSRLQYRPGSSIVQAPVSSRLQYRPGSSIVQAPVSSRLQYHPGSSIVQVPERSYSQCNIRITPPTHHINLRLVDSEGHHSSYRRQVVVLNKPGHQVDQEWWSTQSPSPGVLQSTQEE